MDAIEEKKRIIGYMAEKMIKGSETIAVHAVNSAATVVRVGLSNAEDLAIKANDILLNTARRTINSSSIIGGDVREAAANMLKGTIRTAVEIGDEIKKTVKPEKTIVKGTD